MANRLKMVQKELLFTLFTQNWSNRKINIATGIHRSTISRYREEWEHLRTKESGLEENLSISPIKDNHDDYNAQNVPPEQNKVPTDKVVHFQVPTDLDSKETNTSTKSKAAAYHDIITKKINAGQNARSIFQDLVIEKGYTGSYDSIKRYIRKLRKNHPKLYARIETPAGEEAQVDFGQGAPTLKNGHYRKTWLFVMTLSNSRKSYQEAVWQQDVETFIRCHEHAFSHFGGVTQVIKIDNLKSAVLKAHLYEPQLNPNYLSLAKHYNFAPLPCKVKTPEHKGKVESSVKYVQNNALTGKKFDSIEQQNQYLRHWNKIWASTRIHGTTKRQVNIMFEEEKPALQALPEKPYEFFKIGTRKVNALDSHIEVAGAYYPVPPKYMGREVIVHYNNLWVKVYYQNKLVQFLSVVPKGRFHPDKGCLPEHKNWSQTKYVQYLFDQCSQIGPSVIKWAKQAEAERQQRAYRSIQGIVALAKKYTHSIVNLACQQSIDRHALSYHVVKELAEALRIQKQIQIEIKFSQESDVIRSPLEYQNILSGG